MQWTSKKSLFESFFPPLLRTPAFQHLLFGRLPLDLFPLRLLQAATIRVTAATPLVDGYEILQTDNGFLILSRYGDREMLDGNQFFFSFFFETELFDLIFLLLPNFNHNFFNSSIHFLSVLFSTNRISIYPWMLHQISHRYPLLRIRIQHLFNKILINVKIPLKLAVGWGFPEKIFQN